MESFDLKKFKTINDWRIRNCITILREKGKCSSLICGSCIFSIFNNVKSNPCCSKEGYRKCTNKNVEDERLLGFSKLVLLEYFKNRLRKNQIKAILNGEDFKSYFNRGDLVRCKITGIQGRIKEIKSYEEYKIRGYDEVLSGLNLELLMKGRCKS